MPADFSVTPRKRRPAPKKTIRKKAGPSLGESSRTPKQVRRDEQAASNRAARVRRQAPAQRLAGARVSGKIESHGQGILGAANSAIENAVGSVIPGGTKGGGFGGTREQAQKEKRKQATAPKGSAALGPAFAQANIEQATRVIGKGAQGVGQFTKNAGQDAVNFPTNAVLSAYYTGKLLKEGKFKEAGQGLIDPYKQLVEHPGKTIYEHPFNSYLLVAGVKGGVGRGAGRTMRSGALGKSAKRLASTDRTPATVPGTGMTEKRSHSPDVTKKVREVAVDKHLTRRSQKLHRKAEEAFAAEDTERGAELRAKAVKADPTRMTERQIRRQTVETADANDIARRIERGETTHAIDKAVPRKAAAHVSLHAQSIVTASKADLRAYLAELDAAAKGLSGPKLARNKTLRKQIRQALDSDATPEQIRQASDLVKGTVRPTQEALGKSGVVAAGQVERSPLMPYARRKMGAKYVSEHWEAPSGRTLSDVEVRRMRETMGDEEFRRRAHKVEAHLADSAGGTLTNEQIRAHMKANGVDEPVYLSQAPRSGNPYFIRQDQAPNGRTPKRTATATLEGTFSADKESIRASASRGRGLQSAHEGFSRGIDQAGLRGPDGDLARFSTKKDADDASASFSVDKHGNPNGNEQMVPVRLNPFAGRQEQLQGLLDRVNSDPEDVQVPVKKALESALNGEDGAGEWALIPKVVRDQQLEIVNRMAPTDAMRALQGFGGMFRGAVLSTNPRWLAGNVIETGVRAAVAHAGPRSLVTYVKVRNRLRELDPEAAKMFEARATSGGMFRAQSRLPHRAADQMSQGSLVGKTARALGRVADTPGPKQVVQAWKAWQHLVFDIVNKPAERLGEYAMGGKAIRSDLMDGHLLKLSEKAIDQAARGLLNTSEQVALGRRVDDMFGKYNKRSPAMQQTIALYTPFVSWAINAVNFTYRVLPRDHPVLTALIVDMEMASEKWRKEHGLDQFMAGAVPPFLQGSIPLANGDHQRAPNRYTPFAIGSDLLGSFSDQVLPQFSSALNAAHGKDWMGNDIRKGGQPLNPLDRGMAVLGALLESSVPVYSTAKNVKEKGPNAALNPFYPAKSKSGDEWGGDWGNESGWGDQGDWSDDGWGSQSSNGGWG